MSINDDASESAFVLNDAKSAKLGTKHHSEPKRYKSVGTFDTTKQPAPVNTTNFVSASSEFNKTKHNSKY